MKTFKVRAKDVKWLTDLAFASKKREVVIEVTDTVSFYNTFWDGGSKNSYKAVRLLDGKVAELAVGSSPWNSIAEGKSVTLEPGIAVIEESIFCGKVMSLRIHLHPDNVAPFLPSSNG